MAKQNIEDAVHEAEALVAIINAQVYVRNNDVTTIEPANQSLSQSWDCENSQNIFYLVSKFLWSESQPHVRVLTTYE